MINKDLSHDGYITVGRLGAPYGVRGWLKVQAFTEDAGDLINYQPWFFEATPNQLSELPVEGVEMQGGRVLVKIAQVDSPEAARLLTGKYLLIPRDKLPRLKEGDYYWSDLEGLTVIDQHGVMLGVVCYMLETGANDVMIVKGEKQFAIPYLLNRVVKSVDLRKREIRVEWELLD